MRAKMQVFKKRSICEDEVYVFSEGKTVSRTGGQLFRCPFCKGARIQAVGRYRPFLEDGSLSGLGTGLVAKCLGRLKLKEPERVGSQVRGFYHRASRACGAHVMFVLGDPFSACYWSPEGVAKKALVEVTVRG